MARMQRSRVGSQSKEAGKRMGPPFLSQRGIMRSELICHIPLSSANDRSGIHPGSESNIPNRLTCRMPHRRRSRLCRVRRRRTLGPTFPDPSILQRIEALISTSIIGDTHEHSVQYDITPHLVRSRPIHRESGSHRWRNIMFVLYSHASCL